MTRKTHPDLVTGRTAHYGSGFPHQPPKPRCPVCGTVGYRKIRRMGDDLVHWCSKGHPHYASPNNQWYDYDPPFHDLLMMNRLELGNE